MMSITPNSNNAGHLIISAFQAQDLAGSGTLINLRFNLIGSAGQTTTIAFQDYTDPGGTFHPGFQFNEGDPPAVTTNGSVTVSGGGPTNTSTSTPTSTPTNTPTVTPTGTPGIFANAASICTTLGAPADLYPSNIVVAGGPTQVDGLRVTLFGVTHLMPDNMDFLLVGPNGAKFILMADAGGAIPVSTPGVNLTFSDSAGQVVPESGPLTTGTFEPTSWVPVQTSFPAPAPPAPYNEPGSAVGGTGTQTLRGKFRFANANGTWSLYMRDDAGLFTRPVKVAEADQPNAITGCVGGGWQIQFIPTTAANASLPE